MKKALWLLVVGTMVSGMAAYYAGARVIPAERTDGGARVVPDQRADKEAR